MFFFHSLYVQFFLYVIYIKNDLVIIHINSTIGAYQPFVVIIIFYVLHKGFCKMCHSFTMLLCKRCDKTHRPVLMIFF